MPGGKELFTPVGPTAVSRINSNPVTPSEYISPSTRRHVGLGSPSVFISPSIINDDEAERRERRRSRVLELQRRHLSSPATPPDRRQSASLGGLSNNQLAEHYANCIKLSAENKINAKNAFGLHLIDYMSDVLKKKEMTNFQVASSTLDASAKIYAGRVDAIHTETYKVLSGLGRGNDRSKGDANNHDEEGGNDDQDNVVGEKKRKKARKSNTIETNLKNINVNKFDLEFEVDPLFHKTSATFDEGGTGGLLLNHLCVRDDTSEIVLDSNTVIMNIDSHNDVPSSQAERAHKMINLKELRDLYAGVKLEPLQICPAFADFQFTNWSKECEDLFSSRIKAVSSEHAFDLDAEPEALPARQDEEPQDFEDDGFGHMADDDDNDDVMSRVGDHEEREMLLADSKEAHVVESAMHNIKHGTVGNLMQVLAVEPGEYSYFNQNLLRTWAGPEHWKLRLKLKDGQGRADDKGSKKSKEKKETFNLDYSEEVDFDSHFKRTRAATTLAKTTLEKYSKSQTTLPEDLHYDGDKLFKLFVKPTVMIKRQKKGLEDVDDGIADYDYDNTNDRDNFCPAGGDDLGDMDDDDDNEEAPGFNFTQETDYTQQGSFINETAADGTLLSGDGLVSQPKKVAKIDIGYAKAAKKIDVKRVKTIMWDLLTSGCQSEEDKENEDKTEPATSVPNTVAFQKLCETLPGAVTKNMAKNLSIPIAFVCLLHLANEKTLCITCDESMSDLAISQG